MNPKDAPAPIGPLSQLPLFHSLTGRRVLVAGAGHGARWKAELVVASGALVEHFAGRDTEGVGTSDDHDERPRDENPKPIIRINRAWRPDDLAGAALAILDTQSESEAEAFVQAARQAGVPVNVIDKPKWCDFQFGAIVNRSPVVIAISTRGAVPALGQLIRMRIEAMLPRALAGWALLAAELRQTLKSRLPEFVDRRTFWRRFAEAALHADAMPDRATVARWVEGSRAVGRVVFVGGGSGDPELLTLKGLRALQSADVVLYDADVPAALLDYARREAERWCVASVGIEGGEPGHEPMTLAAMAAGGKQVVRLAMGIGAPVAVEMKSACRALGVVVEIIPGVSLSGGGGASGLRAQLIAPALVPKAGFLPKSAYGPTGEEVVMNPTENVIAGVAL